MDNEPENNHVIKEETNENDKEIKHETSLEDTTIADYNNVKNEFTENSNGDTSKVIYPCDPAPPIQIKLFIGRVPHNLNDTDITPLFEKYGEVIETVIIRDRGTMAHKGSAFVRMASISFADAAIRDLNGQKILDTNLGAILVTYATGEADRLGLTSTCSEPGLNQAKLFVGSLPKTITEDEVKDIFESYGTIDEIYIMRDGNGAGKGCAFVKLGYKEQAIHVCASLNGQVTLKNCSRPIEVRLAENRQKVEPVQSPMPMMAGMNMMQPVFIGGDQMAHGFYSSPYNNPIRIPNNNFPRAIGPWKEYFTKEGRPYYHNEINNVTTWEKPDEFMEPQPIGQPKEGLSGPAGANIFVFHIPNDWTDNHLLLAFSQYGEIKSACIAKDKITKRNKGYAFVSYTAPFSASLAIKEMNGFMVGGKRLKVSLKQNDDFGNSTDAGNVANIEQSSIGNMQANLNIANGGGQYSTGYGGNRYAPY